MKFLLQHRFSWADMLVILGLIAISPYTPWYVELGYLVATSIAVVQLERRYDHRP